jgi:hypothetical protein
LVPRTHSETNPNMTLKTKKRREIYRKKEEGNCQVVKAESVTLALLALL